MKAEPAWRTVDFISDLHLQVGEPATAAAWQRYMASTPADALFILGDLFEVWVGDDLMAATDDPDAAFARQCQQILQATSRRLPVYFMHGNRDFLLGEDVARASGMTLLPDPTVLDFADQRYLLSHGDALCLGDVDYQQFRVQVRQPTWQAHFLAKPLAERQAFARGLRAQSAARKDSGATYADVDTAAALSCLHAHGASTLIHGHTHRPQDHLLDADAQPPLRRLVLSDWDAVAQPPRLEVLRLRAGHAPGRVALAPTP
ncbi:UDP-2,3-diacylglucosamine diphosphatase [Rhodoferax sp.]|uniref:UDP-2,3-diacylglucosamine diphosphatase n=1 Tax=Rhodoferax sp. TaxID=50421 RepID=UPI002726A2F4|nr:UDP-2,3-diacylglucosamine diphosphatase [Rhodoferax sp.]MDO9143897.1 UDP-2,3-diacylglucosamine diphosphatase [Rhodoferax sp.]MDP1528861.1 UDP-2,3-diacylglucosamine diphosphatase [Rhodoferax sp.]MDP1943547.1 UDP-2,3-diacylglucosamine diphosphatase [Rhodoferax sp.]MDP2442052.1 UDP-2,3-diacylglucosamine diphosphatase [Rhodoferax sp.]MDP3190482.1 UDP-2,3-diacylglucosamine diphosphatase [Rhodoferax sp.]